MSMYLNHQLEQFSRVYVRAVATVAGFGVYEPSVDHDSIDIGFAARGGAGTFRSPRLEAQLKCTSSLAVTGPSLPLPLKMKNYEDLRVACVVPRVLIVVCVPEDMSDWFSQDENEMVLRRCGYWMSLMGAPEVANDANVTVRLPRTNIFSPNALRGMMENVSKGLLL